MSDISWETEQFERHRPHLEAVAYRMLGSVSEAEDFDALVAVLDPGVVFRAGEERELQQELNGAPAVARKFATFGPAFASKCHPATVNGRAGLILRTGQGAAVAAGFIFSGGLISAIDLTLDPDKLEGFDDTQAATSWPSGWTGGSHRVGAALRARLAQ